MKKLFLIPFFTLISAFALIPATAYSHPHVIVTYDVSFLLNEHGVHGIKMNWDMDEMFSASLIDSFDENKDGKFDANEIKVIENEAFSNLQNYHYMTYSYLNDKPNKFFPAEKFHASINDGVVRYTFTLPVKVNAEKSKKTLEVSVYDESNFMSFSFTDSIEVETNNNPAFTHSSNVKKKKVKTVYDTEESRNIAQLVFNK